MCGTERSLIMIKVTEPENVSLGNLPSMASEVAPLITTQFESTCGVAIISSKGKYKILSVLHFFQAQQLLVFFNFDLNFLINLKTFKV